MIPTTKQFNLTVVLCAVLRTTGASVALETRKAFGQTSPAIVVYKKGKIYHFADPCWNVVNKQLGCLANSFAMS